MTQSTYLEYVKESLAARRDRSPGRIGRPVAVLAVAVLLYLALALFLAPDDRPHHEFMEGGIVTWMSGALLALTSLLALLCFLAQPEASARGSRFWLLAAIGFLYFCADELLQGHEKVGKLINASAVGPLPAFWQWNDLIIIAYGLAALVVLLAYLPEVVKHPGFAETIGVAAAAFAVHTAIDTFVRYPDSTWLIAEESAKLFSVTLLAFAAYRALVSIKRER